MTTNINIAEAADKIAREKIIAYYNGDNSYYHKDDEGNFTDEAQEQYEEFYESAFDMLMSCNPQSYQDQALRTLSSDYSAIQARLNGPIMINLLHSAIGLATEAAEALDMLKKHIYYGKPLDMVNFAEEIGDIQWYAAIGADWTGTTLEKIQETNIAKLRARYPEKFTSEDAINRDLETEREILEAGQ